MRDETQRQTHIVPGARVLNRNCLEISSLYISVSRYSSLLVLMRIQLKQPQSQHNIFVSLINEIPGPRPMRGLDQVVTVNDSMGDFPFPAGSLIVS